MSWKKSPANYPSREDFLEKIDNNLNNFMLSLGSLRKLWQVRNSKYCYYSSVFYVFFFNLKTNVQDTHLKANGTKIYRTKTRCQFFLLLCLF